MPTRQLEYGLVYNHENTQGYDDLKTLRMAFALMTVVAVAGCTTAGPYVTNISSDGSNGLNIEKCAVKLNAFMGTVSTTECTSQRIQLSRQ